MNSASEAATWEQLAVPRTVHVSIQPTQPLCVSYSTRFGIRELVPHIECYFLDVTKRLIPWEAVREAAARGTRVASCSYIVY